MNKCLVNCIKIKYEQTEIYVIKLTTTGTKLMKKYKIKMKFSGFL